MRQESREKNPGGARRTQRGHSCRLKKVRESKWKLSPRTWGVGAIENTRTGGGVDLTQQAANTMSMKNELKPQTSPEEQAQTEQRRQEIVALARDTWEDSDQGIEVDNNANLSEGDENGCFVQAWVWVPFDGTKFDKGNA